MAQQFTTEDGVVLTIPGTYVKTNVQANQGGTAAAGVVILVGEADQGPDYTREANLDGNSFAPDNLQGVIAKYQSGRLVDAFREISAAASDPNIVGSVSLVKLVKTNPSTPATAALLQGVSQYGIMTANVFGQPGNLIKYNSDISVPEIAPSTGPFAYTPIYTGSVSFSLRQNGSALEAVTVASLESGPTLAAAIGGLGGTAVTGGTQILPLTGLVGNVSAAVVGVHTIQLSLPGFMTAPPSVGDSLVIPLNGQFGAASDSVLKGAADANVGSYVITEVVNSAGTSTITAAAINGPSGQPSVVVVSAVSIGASTDIICYAKMSIQNSTNSGNPINGLGKSMEIDGTLSSIARDIATTAPASFATGNPLLVSASELVNAFTVTQGNTTNTVYSGGDLIAAFSCSVELATMVVGATSLAFKIGSTTIFTLPFTSYPTMQNVVDFVNSQSTFYAEVISPKWALLSPAMLDKGTFSLSSSEASVNMPARLKQDAVEFQANVSGSGLVTFALSIQSGLPDVISPPLLMANGSKAGTTSAEFADAIDACEGVVTNFIVPVVSQDASLDIPLGLTDPSSTYSIDAVNAACKSHVILMSTLQARQNRVAIVSKSDTYANQKAAAAEMSSFRVGFAFQQVNCLSGNGTIQTYQPWMAAVVAAGMQSAAGYKGIVKKYANITGISSPKGDFNPTIPSMLTDALVSGLLILESVKTGGFRWVSDQMTYSQDNNFVYNSLQAVYISDLMALTLIQNFDNAIVGQSVATISASVALGFLQAQMFDFLRLHWIAPSDGAPQGYRNASVKITGGVMSINVDCFLAGLLYFVPIQMQLSQVQQSAG